MFRGGIKDLPTSETCITDKKKLEACFVASTHALTDTARMSAHICPDIHKLARRGAISRGPGRRADRVGSRYNHKPPTVSPLNWNSSQRTRGWRCDAYIVLWLHGRTRRQTGSMAFKCPAMHEREHSYASY
jgi:hypothetical protein